MSKTLRIYKCYYNKHNNYNAPLKVAFNKVAFVKRILYN